MIIEEIFELYDSGQLRGKIVKMTYNRATHLVYDFTDFGGIKKFRRNILNTNVANNECSITDFMTDYLSTLLAAIKSQSFVDNNLFH